MYLLPFRDGTMFTRRYSRPQACPHARPNLSPLAISMAAPFLLAAPVFAQTPPSLGEVVVTSNPLGGTESDQVSPIRVLRGAELEANRRGTLGDMLSSEPGVANTGFGPNAGRPVIRGQDGDRIRVLNNGTALFDASATSPDHAVGINPIIADRVEVIRGTAALRYGGNAVGGVVNILDGRTPVEADPGISGEVRASTGLNISEDSLAAKITAAGPSAGQGFAVSADAFSTRTGDIKIPGFARSEAIRAQASPRFEAPTGGEPALKISNSNSRQEGGSVGAAYRDTWGYVGVNTQTLRSNYGVGVYTEPNTRIGLEQERQEVKARLNLGGFVEALEASGMNSRYRHAELNNGQADTTFRTNGNELRLEALHRPVGPWRGVLGWQGSRFDFSAVDAAGANSFLPNTNTRAQALYLTEQATFGAISVSGGVRHERHRVGADDSVLALGCGQGGQKDFPLNSGSLGAKWALNSQHALTAQISHTERAPTYQELFACGEHAATLANEYGNAGLRKEKSNQIEAGWQYQARDTQLSLNAYHQLFSDYVALLADPTSLDPTLDTGRGNRGTSDSGNFFPDYLYTPVRARFMGFEAVMKQVLSPATFGLPDGVKPSLELKADRVRADDLSNQQPLPRIAPMRLGLTGVLTYPKGSSRLTVQYVSRQDRLGEGELPTDAYTMVNAFTTYRLFTGSQGLVVELFGQANNLLNQEARNHVSFLKDVLPLQGRTLRVGIRTVF